jgi:actin related protein 2/3 complex, subunit 4
VAAAAATESTGTALITRREIQKNDAEVALIESSSNSVRLSVKIKQQDDIERMICHDFCRFLMQRADHFLIFRRKALAV